MVAPPTILIADRDRDGLTAYSDRLDLHFQCTLLESSCAEELRAALAKNSIDILVIDVNFAADREGVAFIASLRNQFPKTAILPIIPSGQAHLIKQLLALDLFYFIHKPIDPLETRIALKRVYETLRPAGRQAQAVTASKPPSFHGMIGSTRIMQRLFEMISRVAADDVATVLIRGESGTGKEMIAKAIHAESRRRDKNFVPVNCAAIPDDLLESELFGYTKGAFTGAIANKRAEFNMPIKAPSSSMKSAT